MRGLKYAIVYRTGVFYLVALFVSAWIEIIIEYCLTNSINVALFVSAWIEIIKAKNYKKHLPVALFVSAWIEICETESQKNILIDVALFVSAWIEINIESVRLIIDLKSHSL